MKIQYFAQKAFIAHSGKLLLIQKSAQDPNQPGKWEVPGGRMDFGEDIDDHIKREVFEETGLSVSPDMPFHIWQWQLQRLDGNGSIIEMQIVAVARLCKTHSDVFSSINQVQDDYISEIRWVNFDDVLSYDLIENMIPAVNAFIDVIKYINAS